MDTRIAKDKFPKSCFSVEYNPEAPKCLGCELAADCKQSLGGRIPLSAVKFNLTPEKLPVVAKLACEETAITVNETYRQSYYAVYKQWPDKDIGSRWREALENSKQAGCSLKMFFTTLMAGHKLTHPGKPFFVSMATSAGSADSVEKMKQVCVRQSASFDATTLGIVLGEDYTNDTIDAKLLRSEVTAGLFVSGFKMRSGKSALLPLYESEEYSLDPYWLAIEPSYGKLILQPYTEAKRTGTVNVSGEIAKLRHEVAQTRAMLVSKPRLASSVFAARERIAPEALKKVLYRHGIKPSDVYHLDEPVTDLMSVWNAVGFVLQHMECIKFLEGKPNKL